jgi:nitroreductase
MELAVGRRSIRRFTSERVKREDLVSLVKAGMYAPSAGNGQVWQFIIVEDAQTVRRVNKNLGWLGGAPEETEQARAHIVILLANPEKKWTLYADGGAAAGAISLAAAEKGIGSCWVGSVNRDDVRALLQVPQELEIFSVIALGYPAEEPAVTEVDTLGKPSAKRDESGRLIVQKLKLEAVCHLGRYGQKLS